MQNLRLLLILQSVKQSGVVVFSNPTEDALDKGEGNFALEFVVATKISESDLHNQCNIDMVEEIHVSPFVPPETEMEALEKKVEVSSPIESPSPVHIETEHHSEENHLSNKMETLRRQFQILKLLCEP